MLSTRWALCCDMMSVTSCAEPLRPSWLYGHRLCLGAMQIHILFPGWAICHAPGWHGTCTVFTWLCSHRGCLHSMQQLGCICSGQEMMLRT